MNGILDDWGLERIYLTGPLVLVHDAVNMYVEFEAGWFALVEIEK